MFVSIANDLPVTELKISVNIQTIHGIINISVYYNNITNITTLYEDILCLCC